MNIDPKIAVSDLYIQLSKDPSSPLGKAMELYLMDTAVECLKKMAENSDKLAKILDMMDSRLMGLSEKVSILDDNVMKQLQGINHQVSGD